VLNNLKINNMNNLTLKGIREIAALNDNDAELFLEYNDNWSEESPAHFDNGDTIKDLWLRRFDEWLNDSNNDWIRKFVDGLTDGSEILENAIEIIENELNSWIWDYEYDIQLVLDLYKGNMEDYIIFGEDDCDDDYSFVSLIYSACNDMGIDCI